MLHYQIAGTVRGEIGHHPNDAVIGVQCAAEPHQCLSLTPKPVQAISKQRGVLIGGDQHSEILTGRELPREILFDREALPNAVVCEIGDAEPAATEDAVDRVTGTGLCRVAGQTLATVRPRR